MYQQRSAFFCTTDHDDLLPRAIVESIDLHFARFMMQLSVSKNPDLALAAALLSRLGREGHTCMDLRSSHVPLPEEGTTPGVVLPDPDAWIRSLRKESVVGTPGEYRPLILDSRGRLYLQRTHAQESALARRLLDLNRRELDVDERTFRQAFARYFADSEPQQKIAATIAATRSLCVITGGPGTGKTTLVLRILAMLLELEPGLKIALSAPTGKAAQRIAGSVLEGMGSIGGSSRLQKMIPHEASTLHRLLGFSAGSTRPRHRADNPLSADVVVVDEASMADLALMENLAQALKEGARLILLGDRNQLASVAAGYVLGDICDTGRIHGYSKGFAGLAGRIAGLSVVSGEEPGMQDSLVELTRTYRFRQDSPISLLSAAVNEGDAAACMEILTSRTSEGICARGLPHPDKLKSELKNAILSGYGPFLSTDDPLARLELFGSFRVLCPVREGPYGVKAMNRIIESILAEAGLLEPAGLHYRGRPVLVMENDYTLRLFNGDTGIVVEDDDGGLRVCFPDGNASVRLISPMRLPKHETAFAVTVHKSQGSEFDRIMLVLPERDSPVLTRELVYTAVTRARASVEVWMDNDIFARAVARRTLRHSGLNGLLWDRHDTPSVQAG